MAAGFPTISFVYETEAGDIQPVDAGVTVIAASEIGGTLDTFVTDADGRVLADTVAGAVGGDIIHFRIENFNGMAGSVAVRVG